MRHAVDSALDSPHAFYRAGHQLLEFSGELRHLQQHKHHRQQQQKNRGHGVRQLSEQTGDQGHHGVGVDVFVKLHHRDGKTQALQPGGDGLHRFVEIVAVLRQGARQLVKRGPQRGQQHNG